MSRLPRIDGSLFGNENGRKRWTQQEDVFLLFYHKAVGVDFVAGHDLRRSRDAAYKRLAWLRKNRPDLCAKYEVKAGDEA